MDQACFLGQVLSLNLCRFTRRCSRDQQRMGCNLRFWRVYWRRFYDSWDRSYLPNRLRRRFFNWCRAPSLSRISSRFSPWHFLTIYVTFTILTHSHLCWTNTSYVFTLLRGTSQSRLRNDVRILRPYYHTISSRRIFITSSTERRIFFAISTATRQAEVLKVLVIER